MSNSSANLSIWAGDEAVVVRISGRANFQSSVDFKATLLELWQRGSKRFILDLTHCQLMDSTFLGVMAGLGLKFSQDPKSPGSSGIELLNPSARVADLFDNLGVTHLFCISTAPVPPIAGGAAGGDAANPLPTLTPVEPVTLGPASRAETTRVCFEAHKLLMQLNEANVSKFKDVTKFLEEDLKRMEEAGQPGEKQS